MSETVIQPGQVMTIATPINLVLFSLLALLLYMRFKPKPAPSLPKRPPPIVFKTYTPSELLPFNGEDGNPIFFAVRGKVFDVSDGRRFYGPGGPYENFAGRDASRGLACGSFDEEMLTKNLEGPLDTLEDLGPQEMESLRGWEEQFNGKYLVIGNLISVAEKQKAK